jgi:hypothetical protein
MAAIDTPNTVKAMLMDRQHGEQGLHETILAV